MIDPQQTAVKRNKTHSKQYKYNERHPVSKPLEINLLLMYITCAFKASKSLDI